MRSAIVAPREKRTRLAALAMAIAAATGAVLAAERERKVLIISVDGCRPDALIAADTPNIDALAAGGAFSYQAQTGDVPISGPSYSNMFTGVWRDKHGVYDNSFDGARFDLYPIFFCRLKAWDPAIVTQSIVRWAPLDPNLISCADYHTAPSSDAKAHQEGVALLSSSGTDVLFLHFEDVDTAGHASGFSPTAAGYIAAIEASDARVGAAVQAVRNRPTYPQEDWLIIVLSDHGGSAKDHHADTPENRTIFIIMDGPGVVPGELQPPPGIVDIAATAMTYLGLATDPAWDLDGVPIGLATEPPPGGQIPSDSNQDGVLGIADVVWFLGYLFGGGPAELPCGDVGTASGASTALLDANGDARLDISDAVWVLRHLFGSGPAPALGASCVPIAGCPGVCVARQ